jgi:uncharacterized membrane protein
MKYHYIILASALIVSACGDTREDRAATGALAGAATGALVGAAFHSPVTGAAIGAGVGGTVGALTDKADIDLGKPWWK